MDALLRPVAADEIDATALALSYGFGERWAVDADEEWPRVELDRTVAAFVDDEIAATGRNYSLELTLPGGAVVPAGGVSWISTRPTHRRRGLLRQLMTYLVNESRERGEMASMLTASEGGIYPRFGYGVATRIASVYIAKESATFRSPPRTLALQLVEPDVSAALAAPLFDRFRRSRVGGVSRPDAWWGSEWFDPDSADPKRRFDVVVRDGNEVVGYALYVVRGDWTDGFTEKVVSVRDLVAVTDDAEAALWAFLLEIDQTVGVRAFNVAPDCPLPWLLTDPRQMRTEHVRDWLWLRPIDTARLLAARTYCARGELVIEVRDPFLELDETRGRFALAGAEDGATCSRTDREPDLQMDVDALGAVILGDARPSVLARGGRIDAPSDGALVIADAMFRSDRAPYASTWF